MATRALSYDTGLAVIRVNGFAMLDTGAPGSKGPKRVWDGSRPSDGTSKTGPSSSEGVIS